MRYSKEFPDANKQRWYVELVLHGKTEWNAEHAEKNYLFYEEQQLIDYHEFAGCYLKVLREEAAYERSPQGKIDRLRDDILDLQDQIIQYRKWYIEAQRNGKKDFAEYLAQQGKEFKLEIEAKQSEIIKTMTGRK